MGDDDFMTHKDCFRVPRTDAVERWQQQHRHEHVYKGAIGGGWTWSFTPTSIGVVVKAHCATCDNTTDFSDYGSW